MRLAGVHAVGPSRAGSVPGIRMNCAAALEALESLHARERARAMSCHATPMPHHRGRSSSYILYGLRAGRSQVYF